MSKNSFRGSAAGALLLGTLVASPAVADGTPTETGSETAKRADKLAGEAAQAVERGDLERSRTLFHESMLLKSSYDTMGNLGAVELALKRYRDCAEHLAASLRDYPPTASEASKNATLEKLGECRSHVASLKLDIHPVGTQITVDGAAAGSSPLRDALFVEPGPHVVRFTHAGHQPAEQTLEAKAGTERDLRVTLAPVVEAARAPIWPIVVGSLGTAALVGVGIGVHFAAVTAEKEGDALAEDLRAAKKVCPADCGALIEQYDSASAIRNAATGLFIGSGVALAGTAAYYFVFRPTRVRQQTAWVPLFDGQNVGLLMRSEF